MRIRAPLRRALALKAARRAAGIIAVSQYAADAVQDSFPATPHGARLIYHGGPRSKDVSSAGPIRRFLFVSSIHKYKALDELVTALAGIAESWTLDVAGDRADEPYCREVDRQVSSLGLNRRITFHGALSSQQLASLYDRSDCLVWPSHAETFGHPLVEARGHGLPIISSAACSNREIAGSSAHYFESGDIPGLRTALELACRGGLVVGRPPRDYDWDTTAELTATFLREVVDAQCQC